MNRCLWLAFLVACGGKPEAKDDGPRPPDTTPPADSSVDAPALPACANPVRGTTVTLREVAHVGGSPMLVTSPPGDPKLYILSKSGAIRIADETETVLAEPFLDLSDDSGGPIVAAGELGMLGLAFHPAYQTNGTFFIYFTRAQPDDTTYPYRDVLARCQRSARDPNKADPTSCTDVLVIEDYAANHNGGMIEFGPDGFLYLGTGDGGQQNDPDGNGQTLVDGQPVPRSRALLGKMLRIDVDHPSRGKPYGIPAGNPFPTAPEVFMRGFRNPWRWSFDRATGDMWIGDVGQSTIEEIHYVKAGTGAGKNFGWDMWDGTKCFANRTPMQPCTMEGFEFPVDERKHGAIANGGDEFEAIIGGQVYRGSCYPDLAGTYFYSDFRRAGLATATLNADGATITKADLTGVFPAGPASIHAAATGELYLTTVSGSVYRIEAGP